MTITALVICVVAPLAWLVGYPLAASGILPKPSGMEGLSAGVDLTQFWGSLYLGGVAITSLLAGVILLLRGWQGRVLYMAAGAVGLLVAVVAFPLSFNQWHTDSVKYVTNLWQSSISPYDCKSSCSATAPSTDVAKFHRWSVRLSGSSSGEQVELFEGTELRGANSVDDFSTDSTTLGVALITAGSDDPSKWYVVLSQPDTVTAFHAQPFEKAWSTRKFATAKLPRYFTPSNPFDGYFAQLGGMLMVERSFGGYNDVAGVNVRNGKLAWEAHCPVLGNSLAGENFLKQKSPTSVVFACNYTHMNGETDVYALSSTGKMKRISHGPLNSSRYDL